MTFEEDYATILQNGAWTLHKKCPPIIEEWEAEEPPDEAIRLINSDVEVEEGTASDGTIIYERESGTIVFWTSNKAERSNIEQDIKDIIKDSGDNALIIGLIPTSFLDKYGMEFTVRRIP